MCADELMEAIEPTTSAHPKTAARTGGATGLEWAVIVLALINVAFTVRRLLPIFSPADPALLPVVTTGCEEEALFSIWKFVQGQPVYSDPSSVPYAISYFNWLFYWLYGSVTKGLLGVLHLDVIWLPTIVRGVTLSLAIGSATIAYAIIHELNAWPARWSKIAKLSFVSLCFFNDLFGEWIATARPDVGALFFELIALWSALKYLQEGKRLFLCAAVLGCYGAWAFKHNIVGVVASLCLVLAVTGRWRALAFLICTTLLLYGLTFGLGGPLYRFAILESQKQCAFSFEQCWRVLQRGFDVAAYLPVISLMSLGTLLLCKHLAWDAQRLLVAASGMVSGALMLLASTKHGSYYNYFFAPAVLGLLWLLVLHQKPATEHRAPGWLRLGLPIAMFTFGVMGLRNISVVLARADGQRAALSMAQAQVAELQKSLVAMPAPVLVTDRRYNLPWIQSRAPHFVMAFTYAADRLSGRAYESGGLSNLIAQGYFKTIVTMAGPGMSRRVASIEPGPKIDGAKIDRYLFHHSDSYFDYYQLRSDEVPHGNGNPDLSAAP
jgi:hypothetical protein